MAETARAMGCSEGSVKTHCSRAAHALAEALRARGITLETKMMNEMQFAHRIRQILNQGITGQARGRPAPGAGAQPRARAPQRRAGASHGPTTSPAASGWAGLALRVLLPLALLIACAGAVYTWQQNQRAAEIEEVDALLLTDDLPIDAYLDRGFQNWLKKRDAEQ